MAAAVQTPFAAATAAAAAPHQIIMIPQNLLSEQSKSFLKQRLVLPSNYKPVAAVVGSKRAIPPITATRAAAASIPATKMAVSGLKRPLSPTTKSPTINNSGPTPAKRVFDIESIKEEILVEEEEEEEAGLFSAHQQTAARKRTNLDHLSPEERLMRRKLKNRVAAQTARDKKKQYIDEMEAMLTKIKSERRQLMEENRRLQESNADLQLENTALLQKNQELEARLGIPSSVTNLSVLPDPIDPAALPLSPLSMPRSPSPVLSASSPVVPVVVSPTPDIVTADASPMSAASSPTLTEPAAGGCRVGAPRPRVVVQRLDDLVQELCAGTDADAVGGHGYGVGHVDGDAAITVPLSDNSLDTVEFQYLRDIDVGDVDAAEPATEEALYLERPAIAAAASTDVPAAGLKLSITEHTLQPCETKQAAAAAAAEEEQQIIFDNLEDSLETPTAEKLLDDLWLEHQLRVAKDWTEEAEDLFPGLF